MFDVYDSSLKGKEAVEQLDEQPAPRDSRLPFAIRGLRRHPCFGKSTSKL
jgi:hypothetical protein